MSDICPWAIEPGIMKKYHDLEWGVPVHSDRKMFEFLVLESAQAGLSWMTILKKRENFKNAFSNFNPESVALYTPEKICELMQNRGIIRNRMKIEAAISNAGVFLDIASANGTFCNWIWQYTNGEPIINNFSDMKNMPAKTKLSELISKELKKRGFRFFGPVICYSHMQATGMVNDHMTYCFRHGELS